VKLDKEEKDLMDSVERGQRRSVPGLKRERSRYVRYAKATFRKTRRAMRVDPMESLRHQ
jgi:hypothetical protein